jgi:hypothetical protein
LRLPKRIERLAGIFTFAIQSAIDVPDSPLGALVLPVSKKEPAIRVRGPQPDQSSNHLVVLVHISTKILRLQSRRDYLIFALHHEELSAAETLQLETELSSVEDQLVLLLSDKAA